MYVTGMEIFVKCFTNIPLPLSPCPEIKNCKDNRYFIPKDVSEAAYLLALNVYSYFGFRCKF